MSRRYGRRAALRLGAGAAGAALLAACRGGSPPAAPAGAGAEPARRVEILARARASGSAGPAGSIRLGTLDAVDGDPAGFTRDTRLLAYSRLVATDPRAATLHGDLATAIETPDPLTVRFALVEPVHFHPGGGGLAQPLGGESVKRDFGRRAAEGEHLFKQVVSRVDASGNSVTLKLQGPFSLLFEVLGSPEAGIRSDERYASFQEFIGSGAFMPSQRDESRLALARHPVYHQKGYPRIEGLTVTRFRSEPDWAAAFAGGDLDVMVRHVLADATPLREDVTRLGRAATRQRGFGLSLLPQRGGATVRHIAAFQDQRVRRAVALSLDRRPLLALDGSVASGPVGPAHAADALPESELEAHPLYRRDPAQARALLRAAGHERLAFRIHVPDSDPLRSYGQLIAEQLAAAGFDPRPLLLDPRAWQTAFAAGDFESAVFELGGLLTPDIGLRLHTAGGADGRYSLWGYSNPVFDAAVRDALSAFNPADRARRSRAAQRLLLDDVPAMFPIGAPLEHAFVSRRTGGFEFDAYDFNLGWLAASWETRPLTTPIR